MFLNAQNPIFFSGGFAPRTPYKKYLLGFLTLASVLIGSTDVSPWGGYCSDFHEKKTCGTPYEFSRFFEKSTCFNEFHEVKKTCGTPYKF